MVIDGIKKNGIYFTYDFPQVNISDFDTSLTVNIVINDKTIYNERMSSTKVSFNDLGRLLNAYTVKPKQSVSGLYNVLPTDVSITFTDNIKAEVYTIKIFSSRMKLSSPPDQLTTFISRYQTVVTAKGRDEYVTFMYTGNSYLKISLAYKVKSKVNFTKRNLTYGNISKNTILNQLVSIKEIARRFGVAIDDILYYDVALLNNDVITDKIRYNNDKSHYYSTYNVIYTNAVGLWDTFAFIGSIVHESEFSSQILHFLDRNEQINSRVKRYKSINTGFLSKAKRLALEDLITSDEVYNYDAEGVKQLLIIEETEMKYTEHNGEVNSATVKISPAEIYEDELNRDEYVEKRVFDDSFDETFN